MMTSWRAILGDAGVPDLGVVLRLDVLDERAARGDVHHLQAEADSEGGDVVAARGGGEGEVVLLAARVHPLAARVALFAVDGGIAVEAAGEQDAVETAQQFLGVLGLLIGADVQLPVPERYAHIRPAEY